MVRATSSGGACRGGSSRGGLDGRPDAVGGQLVEAGLGGGVGGVELGVAPGRVDHHVVDQHHPLAPVVEGGQLADDGQDGVGLAEVVGRDVGQVLDLAHHVVAEVADQAGVQRRQVGEVRRVDGVEDGLERGQHAVVAGDAAARPARRGRRVPRVVTWWPWATSVASGLRPTKEYRPQRSPPSTDSSRKPLVSPVPTSWRKAPTGVTVSATSSRQTGHDPVGRASGPEALGPRTDRLGHEPTARRPTVAEGAVEAAAVAGVAGARALLVDGHQQRVAVAVVAHAAHVLAVARGLALAPVLLAAPAPEPRPAGLERAWPATRRSSRRTSARCRPWRPGRWPPPGRRRCRRSPRAPRRCGARGWR